MKTILLIEDNNDLRENTAEILEMARYNVLTASDGLIGIDLVRNNEVDLIICDIMMPGLDGYGVLHMLSKDEKLGTIPFIFLTAKSERSDQRKGMELGADDYITKPFDNTELLNAVETRLKKMEAIHKNYEASPDGVGQLISDFAGQQALDKFIEGKRHNHYHKKEHIYLEKNYPLGLYYINSGTVKIFKTHPYGKELITDLLKNGEFFGYNALIEDKPYSETAEAMDECEITFIPKDDFNKLIFSNLGVSKGFIKILSNGIANKQNRLLNLAYSSVRKRTAEALVMLKERFNKENSTGIDISISREDLANIVGTATESLIRTLSDFRDEKLIETKEGKIFIIDEFKLKNIKG